MSVDYAIKPDNVVSDNAVHVILDAINKINKYSHKLMQLIGDEFIDVLLSATDAYESEVDYLMKVKNLYEVENRTTEEFLSKHEKVTRLLVDVHSSVRKFFPKEMLSVRYDEDFDAIHLVINIKDTNVEKNEKKYFALLDESSADTSKPEAMIYVVHRYV